MEPTSLALIMEAVALGLANGTQNAASTAVADTYNGLKRKIGIALRRTDDEMDDLVAADGHERLKAELAALKADESGELEQSANAVRSAANGSANYIVDVHDSEGVVVGSHNHNVFTFGSRPPRDASRADEVAK